MSKRFFDTFVGAALALLALPVIAFFAVALAISLRAWPFFVHERVGREGRHFRFPKLRTLPPQAPAYGLKTEVAPVTPSRVARFLRASHLDELPQLLLVPLGHLSIVGPRPKMPDEFEPVDPMYSRVRTQVSQGCTGLWQISRHSDALPHEYPEYDFFYVENQSLALDLWILWRTALDMAHIGKRVGLEDVPQFLIRSRPVTAPSYSGSVIAFASDDALQWDAAVSA